MATVQQQSVSSHFHLHDLPFEVLLKIMTYLTHTELLLTVSTICSDWYDLAHNATLWIKVTLPRRFWSQNSDVIEGFFHRTPYLSHLRTQFSLQNDHLLGRHVLYFIRSCPRLRILDFRFCSIINFEVVKCLGVYMNHKLTNINLEGCSHVDHSHIECLMSIKSLTKINLRGCNLLEDSSIELLAAELPNIVSLNLNGIERLSYRSVTAIAGQYGEHLEELHLDGEILGNISLQKICTCTQLQTLLIGFAGAFSDQAIANIKGLTHIHHLTLEHIELATDAGLCYLFNPPATHPPATNPPAFHHLITLNLSNFHQLSTTTVITIAQCCSATLEVLCLDWCWDVSDVGVESIVDHCSQLQTLSLIGVHLTTNRCLRNVPTKLTALKRLDLQQCNLVEDSVIISLIRSMNQLTVVNYYGEQFVKETG